MARKKRTRESRKSGKQRQRGSQEETRKKENRSSRRDKFARQRFGSWVWFLGKIALFVIPILGITTWLIVRLLLAGAHVPVLTLDYSSSENRSQDNWFQVNFSLASNNQLDLKSKSSDGPRLQFGGPNKDVVFVFADILGDVRSIEGRDVPCVFVANDQEEHETQAYVGLTETETESTANQWVTIDAFLKKILDGIEDGFDDSEPGKVVVVLDVDHPDLPARLPPELNQFVLLCQQRWPTFASNLSKHEVFLWLSHSPGQQSYLDSDPQQVESFFKKRFELAITGDVLELGWEDRKEWVRYQQVKSYIKRWVETDASVHLLAQTPIFLEPEGFAETNDFPVLEFDQRPAETKVNGKLFDYHQRTLNPRLDQEWKRYYEVAREREWDGENPLLRQRCLMLLLQMEKLWYRGLDRDRQLFRSLASQLDGAGGIFELDVAIEPYQHSLIEEWMARNVPNPPPLDLDLISKTVVGADPATNDAVKELQRRKDAWSEWQQDHSNWNGELALSCWRALTPENASFGKEELVNILKALEAHPNQVSQVFSAATSESVQPADVNWNEIGYLKRLADDDELIWPEKPNARTAFTKIVQLSIRARHQSNRFAAELRAPLATQFADAFAALERRRRVCEDKMFAHDLGELASLYSRLLEDYRDLQADHDSVRNEFIALQNDLLLAPHDLRYAIQSTIVADQYKEDVAGEFEKWLTESGGFADRWDELGGQKVSAFAKEPDNRPTRKFEELRKTLLTELEVTIADEQKRLATNAWDDQQWLSDRLIEANGKVEFMSVSDGNLLARRLLTWPGLTMDQRVKVHQGLSQINHVDPSGEADDSVPFQVKSTAQQLGKILEDNDIGIQYRLNEEALAYNPNAKVEGDESFFIQVAHGAHRQLITSQANDLSSLSMAQAVNDFRRRKSNVMFQRVKNDLWGTPRTVGKSFVESALSNHINVTDVRVEEFDESVFQQTIKDTWNAGGRTSWSSELDKTRQFASSFQRFQWERADQIATNQPLAKTMGTAPEPMVFSVYPQRRAEAIRPSKFDVTEAVLDTTAFRGQANRQLTVYLRGHVRDLTVLAAAKAPRQKVIPVMPDLGRFSFSELAVRRDEIGPSTGHVTFVIDCSNSMSAAVQQRGAESSRMDRLKKDLVEFLDQISQRSDIAVSLVAIGATERWSRENVPAGKTRDAKDLRRWEKVNNRDVWLYRENGKRVTPENVPSLIKAVGELKPHGDTPILGGVDVAIRLTQPDQQNLIVLLTDGFQFSNRLRKRGDSYSGDRSFDPEKLYSSISTALLNNPKLEMVVFSYLTDALEHIREQGIANNDSRLKKYLSIHFGEIIDQGFPHREIVRRIQKIESLADKNKVRHRQGPGSTTLKKFLDDLLPRPYIEAYDEKRDLLSELINYNSQPGSGDRNSVMKKALSKADGELPVGTWRMEVKYSQPKLAANGFANVPAPWTTKQPLAGNERLVFLYDPFRPSLTLESGKLTGDTQTAKLEGQEIVVQLTPKATRNVPEFDMVAAEDNRLTPAPKLAIVQLQSNRQPTKRILLQDFALPEQSSSNIHRVVFPMIRDDLREAMFGDGAADLKFRARSTVPPQLWHKLELGVSDRSQQVTSESGQVELPAEDWGNVMTLMPRNEKYKGYRFLMRRMSRRGETARYALRVESDTLPLDQWLVHVVADNGEIDRYAVSGRARRYTFLDDFQKKPKLVRIEHEFDIELGRIENNRKLFLGIAHLDELKETSEVSVSEYFRSR